MAVPGARGIGVGAGRRPAAQCTARPASENGRKPHEGRQHTASAFSSAWRRWVTAPRIAAVCLLHRPLPALPSIISGGRRAAACTAVLGALSPREHAPVAMTPLPAPPARLRRLDACDASAGIVTTIRDTVSCSWIFYSECRRGLRPFACALALPSSPSAAACALSDVIARTLLRGNL